MMLSGGKYKTLVIGADILIHATAANLKCKGRVIVLQGGKKKTKQNNTTKQHNPNNFKKENTHSLKSMKRTKVQFLVSGGFSVLFVFEIISVIE